MIRVTELTHIAQGEIPPSFRATIKIIYYFWMLTFLTYFWNWVACLAALSGSGSGMGAVCTVEM